MIDNEKYYSNPRLEMAPEDYAPSDWRDDYEPDSVPEEEADDNDE
jgi:hypothetical protein